jgi:phosphonate transport system permease protein
MATIEKPPAGSRPQLAPKPVRPVVRPPKPFFLRSWFALVVFIVLIIAHVVGWRVAQIDPVLLSQKLSDMQRIVGELFKPDIVARDQMQLQLAVTSIVGSQTPPANPEPVRVGEPQLAPIFQAGADGRQPPPDTQTYNASVTVSSSVVAPGQEVIVTGSGFRPNTPGNVVWQSTGVSAAVQTLGSFITDDQGNFSVTVRVPTDADRVISASGFPNTLAVTQTWDVGTPYISNTVWLVLEKIIETVFLALMGTTFAVVMSIPLSFLAARNLMAHNVVGTAIYAVARTVLNVLRSIEVLIMAVIFAAAVGVGPFAGVLALTLHSIASLGKLYSEAIESIDPGPIEAITATGANRLQVIMYAVVPQFIPQFISFTLYRWDINVRMSTVIGFVGGGGIGFILQQYIQLLQWSQASTAIIAIALVVIAMDYASAKIRAAVI